MAFWAQFAFLGVWLLAGVAGWLRKPRMEDEGGHASDEEEGDEGETRGLLE